MSKKLDLINRNELYKQIRLYIGRHFLGETRVDNTLTIGEIASIIADTPFVDAVLVVRCENCDNYAPTESGKVGYCCVHDEIRIANDFCNHGRPKEGE